MWRFNKALYLNSVQHQPSINKVHFVLHSAQYPLALLSARTSRNVL